MGVKPCDRTACTNVMCDELILDGTQYICDECLAELKSVKDGWPESLTRGALWAHISAFMFTRPGTYVQVNRDEEFARLMGHRNDTE